MGINGATCKESIPLRSKKKHKQFCLTDTGLILLKEHPYIGASPDGLISCLCCGRGVLEIKCPYSIIDQEPSATNLVYLAESETKLTYLKTKTNYYQVQGQMAATGTTYCDFFVFTEHGHFLQRIVFNEKVWLEALNNLSWFWLTKIAPKVLQLNVEPEVNTVSVIETKDGDLDDLLLHLDLDPISKSNEKTKTKTNEAPTNIQVPTNSKIKTKNIRKRKIDVNPNECPVCRQELVSEPKDLKEGSIYCDKCCSWLHFHCVGITEESNIPLKKSKWFQSASS